MVQKSDDITERKTFLKKRRKKNNKKKDRCWDILCDHLRGSFDLRHSEGIMEEGSPNHTAK